MLSKNFLKGLQVARTSLRTYSTGGPAKSVLKGINQVTLVGRVGRDAEIKGSEADPVVTFPISISISFKKPDGSPHQQTDWHRVSVFAPNLRDQVLDMVKKDSKVYVSGKLGYTEFVDKYNVTQRRHTVIADEVVKVSDISPGLENKGNEAEMPL